MIKRARNNFEFQLVLWASSESYILPAQGHFLFVLIKSGCTQQDGRKKKTAKRSCVTDVTGLSRVLS